jgi:hypothetical protein
VKKQNNRVHRQGGSKAVSPQVPNKPEAATPPILWRLSGELEEAIDQSEALTLLLTESHSGSEHGGWNDNILNGLVHLGSATNNRLRLAHLAIETALKGGVR